MVLDVALWERRRDIYGKPITGIAARGLFAPARFRSGRRPTAGAFGS